MEDDDIDFETVMRRAGVHPIARRRSLEEEGKPELVRSAPAEVPPVVLRRALEAAERRATVAEQQIAELRSTLGRVQVEMQALQAERERLAEALEASTVAVSGLDHERRVLSQRLGAMPKPGPSPFDLRDLFRARGLQTDDEVVEAMFALSEQPSWLSCLQGGSRTAEVLEACLALVCERPECQAGAVAIVRVTAERCEVCEGSDTRLAFEQLLEACRAVDVTRMAIVGGSPAYHTKLRELGRGSALHLELVGGEGKASRRKAKARVDRVVVWGATMLSHSTSGAYEDMGHVLIRITHRGLAGMLRKLAEILIDESESARS